MFALCSKWKAEDSPMSEKKLYILRIEKEFKNLIRPLKREEYIQLEDNILNEGCRDPIVVWHYTIVDGHNRYEICKRHKIPFAILEMEFECKEAAIAWICANQLGRRSITDETRKFLIGMQYESEKIVHAKKNADGINQHSAANLKGQSAKQVQQPAPTGHMTAQKIAEENHISLGTVQKYAVYTRALEQIGSKAPTLVPKILSGEYKISHKNIMALAEMSPEEIKKLSRRIERSQQPYVQYNRTRREIQEYCTETAETDERPAPSVKDMPAFDPDAEITGLTLTIPSWASSIDRTRTKANLTIISSKARNNLIEALLNLQIAIEEMCEAVKEK